MIPFSRLFQFTERIAEGNSREVRDFQSHFFRVAFTWIGVGTEECILMQETEVRI